MNMIKATYSGDTIKVNAVGQYLSAITSSTVHKQVQECYADLISQFRTSFINPTSIIEKTSEFIAQILIDTMLDADDFEYQFDTATRISGLITFNLAENRGEVAIAKIYFSITEGMHVILSNGTPIVLNSHAKLEFHQLT